MGEPAQPGEDQLTTIIIEGPPKGANTKKVNAYNQTFEAFKKAMNNIFTRKDYAKLKVRLRQIQYVKKEK